MSISVYFVADKPGNEARRELSVLQSGALSSSDNKVFEPILEQARRVLGVSAAGVTIIYQDWAHMIAATGFTPGVYNRSTSLCAHAILSPASVMVVQDARLDERFSGNPFVDESDGIRFYAAAPLLAEDDLPLGTVCVFDGAPRNAWSSDDAAFLRLLSQDIVAMLPGYCNDMALRRSAAR